MRVESLVVRFVSRRTVPFIQLYALYVLGHGEDGPGGGFQGGVIFASSFVLLALAHGWRFGREQVSASVSNALAPTGALLYAGVGLLCLLLGGAFLEYAALAGEGADEVALHYAHHFGLMSIEAGVMITVTASMVVLFFEMARPSYARGYADEGADEDDGSSDA